MKTNLLTRNRFTVALAAFALAACLATPVFADHTAKQGRFTDGDFKFVNEAATASLKEVTLGRMAEKKANDRGVRDFAQQMMTDHQKAYDQLKDIALVKGAVLPVADKDTVARWKEKLDDKGLDFDRAYMKVMVADHKKAVKDFEMISESGDDSALKTWATATLPTLREHLRMAQSLESKLIGEQTRAGGQ